VRALFVKNKVRLARAEQLWPTCTWPSVSASITGIRGENSLSVFVVWWLQGEEIGWKHLFRCM